MKRVPIFLAIVGLVLCYQNCDGYKTMQFDGVAASSTGTENPDTSGATGGTPTPVPTPAPTPSATPLPGSTPTATPPSSVQVSKSFIYAGSSGFIQPFVFDHATEKLTALTRLSIGNDQVGGFAYDPIESLFYVGDSGSQAHLNQISVNTSTGALSVVRQTAFTAGAIHISFSRHDGKVSLYGAAYGFDRFEDSTMAADHSVSLTKAFTYGTKAKPHSSTVDETRGLVFAALLGEGRIVVYSRDVNGLTEIGDIRTPDPRMVRYDAVYDRLFVVAESTTQPSTVKTFKVVRNGTGFTATEMGVFSMGFRGADFDVDHVHNVVVASVRESGKEGAWVLPVTAAGNFDSTRATRFIATTCVEARSMKVTADGNYVVLTCSSGKNIDDVYVYKVSYDASLAVTSTALVASADAGSGGFLSHFVLDVK